VTTVIFSNEVCISFIAMSSRTLLSDLLLHYNRALQSLSIDTACNAIGEISPKMLGFSSARFLEYFLSCNPIDKMWL
jgi:hypothetical protein